MASLSLISVLHLAATWYMVGLIWFVQRVHYPLMAHVPGAAYEEYHRRHVSLTGLVVGPAMIVEALTAVLLVTQLEGTLLAWAWRGLALLVMIWLVTAIFSVPAHVRVPRLLEGAQAHPWRGLPGVYDAYQARAGL